MKEFEFILPKKLARQPKPFRMYHLETVNNFYRGYPQLAFYVVKRAADKRYRKKNLSGGVIPTGAMILTSHPASRRADARKRLKCPFNFSALFGKRSVRITIFKAVPLSAMYWSGQVLRHFVPVGGVTTQKNPHRLGKPAANPTKSVPAPLENGPIYRAGNHPFV